MKIIHTGDWHIGKRLNGVDLLEDQRHMLDQMLEHMDEASIDLVVVAGDVFDRSNPSQSALKLVNEYLYKINIEKGIPVLAISGNHDSRSRLDYGSYWFEKSNYHMRTSLEDITAPVVIDDHHFYMVPHMDVLEAKVFFDDDTIRSHHDVYRRITKEIAEVMDKDAYNVLVGHMFISDGKASDSERPLSIGLSEEVGADLFEAFDLIMLGHLHHPFAITHERIFYSGSLLKYSFSEAKQPKGFRMVDTDAGTKCRFIPLQQQRDLVHYQGTFEDVINEKVAFLDKSAYFKFELSGMSHINDPMAKLKMIYPNVMELRPLVEKREHAVTAVDAHQSSDREIFESFIENVNGEPLTEYQREIFNTYFKGDADEADTD
ncbi:exonuclease SbcCD subunit D [Salinicoccus sp. ID82-1]|uniref:exonuclease SbcCD subunit D n=1 Tax=Salinicoccus sp. ID82-1 TaxID=2820269 RepID=UPI001F236A2E|nr:exonuclease SbcCD subunit D [Salinicoccus sp. ID82-1]MCG1008795.1 exonuclease SbcCD subunit D [Salinicoccus sp. ID82-1]